MDETTKKAFSDYPVGFPEFLTRLGFADRSYHNDAAARAERDLDAGDVGSTLVVWVAEDDAADREMPSGPKFCAFVAPRVDGSTVDEEGKEVYSGDSAEECEAALLDYIPAPAEVL